MSLPCPGPCYKDGKDCERRMLGCRKECKEWQEFEKAKQALYAERERNTLLDSYKHEAFDRYTNERLLKKFRKRKL